MLCRITLINCDGFDCYDGFETNVILNDPVFPVKLKWRKSICKSRDLALLSLQNLSIHQSSEAVSSREMLLHRDIHPVKEYSHGASRRDL